MKTLFFFGTTPEAVKLSPLMKEFRNKKKFDIKVCNSGQHQEMFDQVLQFFDIRPDLHLTIMKQHQNLLDIAEGVLSMHV
jgi:UDP-N-acetylglucosamine 2-epimerase (non-hydrolysing)